MQGKTFILYDHPEFSVFIDNIMSHKPRAKYTLAKDENVKICNWVKSLRFPDGDASNLGGCIDINKCRLKGMKTHDCHVFMQRFIQVAFIEMLLDFT